MFRRFIIAVRRARTIWRYDKCYSKMERERSAIYHMCAGFFSDMGAESAKCRSCPYNMEACLIRYAKEDIQNSIEASFHNAPLINNKEND